MAKLKSHTRNGIDIGNAKKPGEKHYSFPYPEEERQKTTKCPGNI
ncbi:hypothetical protein SAMN02927921_00847 [Sinomicrobium oceani]|uniref:Uncharacterized protein n=1 Tax=Sinomicrobium oceani TaxID=1150368 RepID=A0A1K1MU41_9FLAO|nr:hypothetical protein [Sinomicrobium oceani]SFW26706.1 hypothetical protein SAMN02927921_00847 [Sinomicrobium oceani]